jgi:hypothetical protein
VTQNKYLGLDWDPVSDLGHSGAEWFLAHERNLWMIWDKLACLGLNGCLADFLT